MEQEISILFQEIRLSQGMMKPVPTLTLRGAKIYQGLIGSAAQSDLVGALRDVTCAAPPFAPVTRFGKQMSVRMTSAGKYGWYSDRSGYRYIDRHPNGVPWPPIPAGILALWSDLISPDRGPDCCLINFYGKGARMGLHQDRDEADFRWPVLSISLGDEGLFRIGGTTRGGKTESVWLQSGDVLVLGEEARLAYHGVDRIRFGSSALLPRGGRINVTCRVVD